MDKILRYFVISKKLVVKKKHFLSADVDKCAKMVLAENKINPCFVREGIPEHAPTGLVAYLSAISSYLWYPLEYPKPSRILIEDVLNEQEVWSVGCTHFCFFSSGNVTLIMFESLFGHQSNVLHTLCIFCTEGLREYLNFAMCLQDVVSTGMERLKGNCKF